MIKNKKARLALSQIFILLIGIIAFSYSIGVVEADDSTDLFGIGELELKKFKDLDVPGPEISATPTPAHEYSGKFIEAVFGEGKTSARGTEYLQKGKTVPVTSTGWGYSASGIMQGAMWAAMIYGTAKMIGGLFLDKQESEAFASAIAGGYFAYSATYSVIGKGGVASGLFKSANGVAIEKGFFTAGQWSAIAGVAVGAFILYKMYSSEKTKVITYACEVWEPPEAGANCEKCNQQGILPCSEYQCRSLGAACELINKGTDEETCVWINRKDVKYPVIQPWLDVLTEGYNYKPDAAISPPDRGVKIKPSRREGCVEAFTPLSFGVTTDEPAQCKIDYVRKNDFDSMEFYFGGSSLYKYNHSLKMSLPGATNLDSENLTIENDGDYEIYVRCKDKNGNANTANFVFKYCVDKGPDTTPPLIVTTDLLNNMPIAFNTSEVDIKVYTNEPATCKWSHLDQSYKDMENSMSCSSSIFEMNAQLLYECDATLNGIKNMQENKFYFRCEDQPSAPKEDRNVNKESYIFTIIGTQPLVLNSVGPNTTIKDSTEIIKIELTAETSAGYNEGEAICYYNTEDNDNNYIEFYETHSYTHKQELWLPEGDYEYWIKCVDLGGNTEKAKAIFRVETDIFPPMIIRAFNEDSYLKIMTNEEAECVYDVQNCNYVLDEGIAMTSTGENKTGHYADWNTNTNYYIKCKDYYNNQPNPDRCNIILRAMDI